MTLNDFYRYAESMKKIERDHAWQIEKMGAMMDFERAAVFGAKAAKALSEQEKDRLLTGNWMGRVMPIHDPPDRVTEYMTQLGLSYSLIESFGLFRNGK